MGMQVLSMIVKKQWKCLIGDEREELNEHHRTFYLNRSIFLLTNMCY